MSEARNPSQNRKRRVQRGIGGFALIVAVAAVVVLLQQRQNVSAESDGVALADSAAASSVTDSTQVAASDSAATDSAQVTQKKGGLFAFLKRGSDDAKDDEEEERPAVPVEMAGVERRDVPSYFTGTATVEAEQRVSVLAKIAGTVRELQVDEGDAVKKGQVLLKIDDAEERARLGELQVRARSLEQEYTRTQSLLAKDLASDREFEDKKLLMEEAKAKLHVGEIRLGYTTVRAPFGGRITQRHVHVGEYVQVNQALFDMADFDPLLVRVFMPEREVDRVQVGQNVRVIPDGRPDVSYKGRVRMIAPVVDTRSGTVKVTVELHEKIDDLRIGAFVRVQITTDMHEDALVVPKVALVEEGGETYVYRAQADSVVKVRVQSGYTDETWTEVLVGLQESDRVVTVGQGGLKHGSRVRELVTDSEDVQAAESGADGDDDDSDVARR